MPRSIGNARSNAKQAKLVAKRIEPGQIYWFDRCPPLDGAVEAPHPVVLVLTTDEQGNDLNPVFAAVTTTQLTEDHDRIRLPSVEDYPSTSTGLAKPCLVLPRWVIWIDRSELGANIGHLPKPLLHQLTEAVLNRLDEPGDAPN